MPNSKPLTEEQRIRKNQKEREKYWSNKTWQYWLTRSWKLK